MDYNNKYFVVKNRKDLSITSFEFRKVEGYDLNPRKVKIKDAIDVNKMIVINPSFVEKVAFRKVKSKFDRLISMLMFVLSEDNNDESGETYRQALNNVTKLRLELLTKYKNKLKEEDEIMFNKKIDFIEQELHKRLEYLVVDRVKEGKSR